MAEQTCKTPPGVLVPVIDRNRCEGKQDCVVACPVQVFALGRLTRAERGALTLKGRIKALVHGGRQVRLVRPEACEGCGRCVGSCPEKAIKLVRRDAAASAGAGS